MSSVLPKCGPGVSGTSVSTISTRDCGSAARRTAVEDAGGVGVVPVVQHVHEEIGVSRGQRIGEEVAGHEREARCRRCVGDDVAELEQNTLAPAARRRG